MSSVYLKKNGTLKTCSGLFLQLLLKLWRLYFMQFIAAILRVILPRI